MPYRFSLAGRIQHARTVSLSPRHLGLAGRPGGLYAALDWLGFSEHAESEPESPDRYAIAKHIAIAHNATHGESTKLDATVLGSTTLDAAELDTAELDDTTTAIHTTSIGRSARRVATDVAATRVAASKLRQAKRVAFAQRQTGGFAR